MTSCRYIWQIWTDSGQFSFTMCLKICISRFFSFFSFYFRIFHQEMKRLKTIFGVNSFGANYASVYSLGWFWVCVIHFLDKIKTIVWVKTNDNNNCPFYNHFCPFSAKIMFIFHKKEVQMVILRCLTGLNITWFKNYGLRCKWRPWACLANFQNIATDKWTFYYHIWPFFCQLYGYLSQKWDSDSHFEALEESKS